MPNKVVPHDINVRIAPTSFVNNICGSLSNCWFRFAFVRLLIHVDRPVIRPDLFMSAAGELIAVTLGTSAMITAIWNPFVLKHNALAERFGYSNFCVTFDNAPGSYFAAPMLSLVAYYIMRYVVADSLRSTLMFDAERMSLFRFRLSTTANVLFGVGGLLLPVLLVFPPSQSFWIHVGIFMFFMVSQWFCYLVNVMEEIPFAVLSKRIKIFLAVYTTVTFTLVILLSATAIDYDINHPMKPLVPPILLQTLDYLWFACQLLLVSSLPDAPAINVDYRMEESFW
jgi:hypothetical protein